MKKGIYLVIFIIFLSLIGGVIFYIELNPQKIKNINNKYINNRDAVKFKDFLLSKSGKEIKKIIVERSGGFFEYVAQNLRT